MNGLMEENMTENFILIRNKVMEFIHGKMAENIRDNGKMVSNMD